VSLRVARCAISATVRIVLGRVTGALVGVVALLTPGSAWGNGRFPAANQIVLSPSDPNVVLVRTTYGILPSSDHGTTWAFLCEEALGISQMAIVDPALALTAGDALVAGLRYGGLNVSTDTGCNWRCAGEQLAGEWIVDVAVRPNAPHTVVALTSTLLDAGGGQHVQAFQSVDDGATWTPLGMPLDPSIQVTTIEVAASDPHRLYVSATRGFGPQRTASLFVSIDDGTTWTEHVTPLDTALEVSVYIAGVDPLDADRVYLRTQGKSRLLVTLDAGQSFQIPLVFEGQMLGFALSPDGSKVFAGGDVDGLMVGDRASMSFASQPSIVLGSDGGPTKLYVQCLATRGSELWACADESNGFIAGVSTDDGATFAPKLHLNSVRAPIRCCASAPGALACGADSGGAQCSGDPFTSLCLNVGCAGDGMWDAAAAACSDAEAAAPSTAGPTEKVGHRGASACGCVLAPSRSDGALDTLGLLCAGALRRVVRRRAPDRLACKRASRTTRTRGMR
jgi:hypothetical protein